MHIHRHSPLYRTAAASATAKQLYKRITARPLHLPLQSGATSASLHDRCICHYKAALQAYHCTVAASATARHFTSASLHNRCICHGKAALQARHCITAATCCRKQLCKRIITTPLHLPLQSSSTSVSFHYLCNLLKSSSATSLMIRHGSASTTPYIIHHHRIR